MIDLSGIDAEDLLHRLDLSNIKLTNSGEELNFSCFGSGHSHGDESPSAYLNVGSTAFFCHGCHKRGNAVTLVMEVFNVARPEAERKLRDWYGIEFNEPLHGSMVAETEARFREPDPIIKPTPPPRSWLIGAHFDWGLDTPGPPQDYMLARGFSSEVLNDWQIGYEYLADRITIPVFDLEAELAGIKARAWRDDRVPKYLILGDHGEYHPYGFQPYETSQVVFGLHRNRGSKLAVLFEGELNAIAASQLGVARPVATGMSYLSDVQARLLIRELDELVVFYDYGTAGHDGVWGHRGKPGIVQALEPYMRVRVVEPIEEDPADLLRLGRGDEVLQMIGDAKSSLTHNQLFV